MLVVLNIFFLTCISPLTQTELPIIQINSPVTQKIKGIVGEIERSFIPKTKNINPNTNNTIPIKTIMLYTSFGFSIGI